MAVTCSDGVTSTRNSSGISTPWGALRQDTAGEHVNRHQNNDPCKGEVECTALRAEGPRDAATGQSADNASGDEDDGEMPIDQSRPRIVECCRRAERGDRD